MGIPAFYRWLVDRYPMSVVDMVEEVPLLVNGVPVPVDASKPNPNGVEFDNLYLDMNGIIHPCFHPEDQLAPKSYEDVFKAIFQYIDHIFSMVRPRKLLYMAIDGVAPRAKMNQQRARRFRAAKDAADAAAEAEELRSTLIQDTEKLALLDHVNKLDSNVITPGTEFMATLSTALHYYTHLRLNTDPGWRGIKVILSDANVPGEGEHKIMSYIRLQRNLPGFDPNTRHCLYGLDADLIMLALATHEIHFAILREDVRGSHQKDTSQKIRKDASRTASQQGKQEMKRKEADKTDIKNDASRQKFQFLNIWVLRGYLQHEFRIPDSTVKIDLERVIDDFVFMCLFVGNDFLPHMPSLEISEGAIDLLMYVYKKEFVRMGGYLINSFEIDLERAAHFIQAVGSYENAIFRRRNQLHKERETRFQESSNVRLGGSSAQGRVRGKGSKDFWSSFSHTGDFISQESQNLNAVVQQNKVNGFAHMVSNGSQVKGTAVDQIRLGEEGWKERYYAEKFEVQTEDDYKRVRKHAVVLLPNRVDKFVNGVYIISNCTFDMFAEVLKYTEGICWVMHYYYQGVCSWQWFYPYHYAPFASDFCGLDQLEILFTPGEPFKPFDQLMGVLPTASAHALPLFYRKLLTDSSSPIADFYPDDFELDMNGKRYSWQAVCKLPFIKESRLLAEIAKVEDTLTDEEKQRNSFGADVLFVHISHHLAGKIMSSYRRKKDHPKLLKAKIKRKIDPSVSGGMNGYMYISDRSACPSEICSPIGGVEMIVRNQVLTVLYKNPPAHFHIPSPPKGVMKPGKVISKHDMLPAPVLWHEKTNVLGRIFSERPVPKSISGACLAKLAHKLVSEYYLENGRQTLATCSTEISTVPMEETSSLKELNDETDCTVEPKKRKLGDGDGDGITKKKRKLGHNDCIAKKWRQGGSKGKTKKMKKHRKISHKA